MNKKNSMRIILKIILDLK